MNRALLETAAGGVNGARAQTGLPPASVPEAMRADKPTLITGGAGFVGINVADRLLTAGYPVIVFDSLARRGAELNLRWLTEKHRSGLDVIIADVGQTRLLRLAARRSAHVFHFAAQVAVTSSLLRPRHDFAVNLRGTLNLLESLRGLPSPPSVVFTSTNKVYGACDDLPLVQGKTRYEPVDAAVRAHGISESYPLDFRSPYGCSKGAADQYVLDYARSFGLPSVVFRMSCIYGPHQFGTEDQGWVAHFLISALKRRSLTIYGDGRQVRDLLFVEDLVDALLLAQAHARTLAGHAFNIGGGARNAVSLIELLGLITELTGDRPTLEFAAWRAGDQRYYVSDCRRFQSATGWASRSGVREGLRRLYEWLQRVDGAVTAAVRSPESDARVATYRPRRASLSF